MKTDFAVGQKGEKMRAIDSIGLKQALAVSAILEDKKTIEQIIDEQPTIEPERKKGEWEMVSQHENPPTYIYRCSECRHKSFGFYNFCPNCGADMRGDQ